MSTQHCPLCGQENQCTGNSRCWCVEATVPQELLDSLKPEDKGKRCICQTCIEKYPAPFHNAAK